MCRPSAASSTHRCGRSRSPRSPPTCAPAASARARTPMARAEAAGLSLHRDGPVLRLSGVLDRAAATEAWPALLAQLPGAQVLDVAAVQRLDSAGLALLAEAA